MFSPVVDVGATDVDDTELVGTELVVVVGALEPAPLDVWALALTELEVEFEPVFVPVVVLASVSLLADVVASPVGGVAGPVEHAAVIIDILTIDWVTTDWVMTGWVATKDKPSAENRVEAQASEIRMRRGILPQAATIGNAPEASKARARRVQEVG